MSKLPLLSGNEICKASAKIGYHVGHQTGSHFILRNEKPPYRRLTVRNHKVLTPLILVTNPKERGKKFNLRGCVARTKTLERRELLLEEIPLLKTFPPKTFWWFIFVKNSGYSF